MKPITTILFATDFTENCEQAFEYALGFARQFGARLIVMHVINEPVMRKPDLVATTLSGASALQMAEYILTMLLALARRLPDLVANQKRAEWPRDRWDRFAPVELRASTVGIVG